MAALHTKRPSWPSNNRIARQYTFFNNEGWQLRGGNAYSGLEANTSYTTIAEPNRLTEFVTDPDGIRPTGTDFSHDVMRRLISWAGFTDENGAEIPPNYTRSLSSTGASHVNYDIVFVTEVNFVNGIAGIQLDLVFVDDTTTAHKRIVNNTAVTVSQPVPNVIRARIPFSGSGTAGGPNSPITAINDIGVWKVAPENSTKSRIHFEGFSAYLTTVVQTGHTAVDILDSGQTGASGIDFPDDASFGSQILTVVA